MQILDDCVQHIVDGSVWRHDRVVLALGDAEIEADMLAQGQIVVRYAIPLLARPHLAIVPSLFVSERGAIIKSWKAWRFVYENFQLYPRAEIMGLQTNGDDAQVFLRELDFGAEPRVLAYTAVEQRYPLAQIDRLIKPSALSAPDILVELLEK